MQWQKESRRIYFYIAEVQPILSKDSANRMQSKRGNNIFTFEYAEPKPIFHRNKGIAAGHIKKREKAAFWHYL